MDISDSALFKGLMSEAAFAFAFFDPAGHVLRVNRPVTESSGIPAERLVDRAPGRAAAGRPQPALIEAVAARIAGEATRRSPTSGGRARATTARAGTRRCRSRRCTTTTGELRAIALFGLGEIERRQERGGRWGAARSATARWSNRSRSSSGSARRPARVVADAAKWRAITGQGLEEYLALGLAERGASGGPPADRGGLEGGAARPNMFGGTTGCAPGPADTATSRCGPSHHQARQGGGVGRRQHRRHAAARGRGDARPPDRPARRRRAAHRAAAGRPAQLAEALTVEQVVQVIVDVGRTALAADHSAVALLDPDRARSS